MINSDYYTGFEYNANIAKSHKKLFEKLRAENITEADLGRLIRIFIPLKRLKP